MSTPTSNALTGSDAGHGKGFDLAEFTHLLDLRQAPGYDDKVLAALAVAMLSPIDPTSDGPDPEEGLFVPAGYTYLGQFIDHDLTLDTTSTLNLNKDLKDPTKASNNPSNIRSPRFDLDCVYGNGPDDQPYLYEQADTDSPAGRRYAGASMVLDGHDLPRASNGRALIGDKRNDENSIVNQIQQAFIKFHNQVLRTLVQRGETDRGTALFKKARDQVRWAYQTIILQDYLPRIIEHTTLNGFVSTRAASQNKDAAYVLYKPALRTNLPREFVVAAYRFGHSMVRTGYRLRGPDGHGNGMSMRLPIFTPANDGEGSLLGFDPLPASHVIDDWGRFFPLDHPRPGSHLTVNDGDAAEDPEYNVKVRLQYAYKIDPSLTDPLGHLPGKIASPGDVPAGVGPVGPAGERLPPSLALLNLLRGNRYLIQGGQAFEPIVGHKLDPKYLVTRAKSKDASGKDQYCYVAIDAIDAQLRSDTPLWFYILAEAQRPLVDLWLDRVAKQGPGAMLTADDLLGLTPDPDPTHPEVLRQRGLGGQLGPVGGLIVAEVFYGLLDNDNQSVVYQGPGFMPIWGDGPHTFARLLQFAGLPLTNGQP